MNQITVGELAKIISSGLQDGSLRDDAEVIIGYDGGFCTTGKAAAPNPEGALWIDTDE